MIAIGALLFVWALLAAVLEICGLMWRPLRPYLGFPLLLPLLLADAAKRCPAGRFVARRVAEALCRWCAARIVYRRGLLLVSLLLASMSFGETIDAGSAADKLFVGGAVWNPTTPGYQFLGAPPLEDLRYGLSGASFSYVIPVSNGIYSVALTLMEPNKTAAGQRIFTVTVNGSTSGPIDLFALVGLKKMYVLTMIAVVNNGTLRIDFRPTVGNAVVSAISYAPFALSDLVAGQTIGNSIQLQPGKFLDVYQQSFDDYMSDRRANGPLCDERLKGVFGLVGGTEFGVCWNWGTPAAPMWEWRKQLPPSAVPQ